MTHDKSSSAGHIEVKTPTLYKHKVAYLNELICFCREDVDVLRDLRTVH